MKRVRAGRLRCVAWIAIGLVAGCTSVPLPTMWRMRDFTLESLFAKDPHDFRVAIRTDDRMTRGAGNPAIDIRVDGVSTGPACYAFALVPVDAAAPQELTLDRPAAHRRWFAFGLSKEGIEAFERARRESRLAKTGEAELTLNVAMTDVLAFPEDRPDAPIRIDLALDRRDGYFTLINERTVQGGTGKVVAGESKGAKTDAPKRATKNDKKPCPTAAS